MKNKWLYARIGLWLLASVSSIGIPQEKTDLNWISCAIIPSSIGFFLYFGLTGFLVSKRGEFSASISFSGPFMPMGKYPIQNWYVSGVSACLMGAASIVMGFLKYHGRIALGANLLAIGIMIMVITKIRALQFQHKNEND